jgi:hypothetical protein
MRPIFTDFEADPSGKPARAWFYGAWSLVLASALLAGGASPVSGAQSLPARPLPPLDPPTLASCGSGLKLYDSPFFKICYPKRWHVIRGYGVNYAWWVFSKRKRGEQFDIPYIRVIIAKGIAEPHLAKQTDSAVLGERTYVKTTNEFREVTGKKLNGRYWREIAVGPEFDILAWYEQIKMKNLKQFDRALDSFWVPPPPRVRPKPEK